MFFNGVCLLFIYFCTCWLEYDINSLRQTAVPVLLPFFYLFVQNLNLLHSQVFAVGIFSVNLNITTERNISRSKKGEIHEIVE